MRSIQDKNYSDKKELQGHRSRRGLENIRYPFRNDRRTSVRRIKKQRTNGTPINGRVLNKLNLLKEFFQIVN